MNLNKNYEQHNEYNQNKPDSSSKPAGPSRIICHLNPSLVVIVPLSYCSLCQLKQVGESQKLLYSGGRNPT